MGWTRGAVVSQPASCRTRRPSKCGVAFSELRETTEIADLAVVPAPSRDASKTPRARTTTALERFSLFMISRLTARAERTHRMLLVSVGKGAGIADWGVHRRDIVPQTAI